MLGGNQPTDISLIHRRSNRLAPHHPRPLAYEFINRLTKATISVSCPADTRAKSMKLIENLIRDANSGALELDAFRPAVFGAGNCSESNLGDGDFDGPDAG